MKKILQIGCENFGRGGRSVIIYNLTEYLSERYIIDFLSTNKIVDRRYIQKLEKRNGIILEYIPKYKNRILKEAHRFFSIARMILGSYDIVHINADDAWEALKSAFIARSVGIKKIIIHAHNANVSSKVTLLKKIILYLSQRYINSSNVKKIACSNEAAQYMFGTNQNVTIIENGIDLEKYRFVQTSRQEKRDELEIGDEYVIGTIGRISMQKNPKFVLDIIDSLKRTLTNFKFIWIGDGELSEIIKKEAVDRGLDSYIKFLGSRSDIPELLMAMDVFILPSFYEGFGIVNLEAQASGLACFVSATIPQNVKVNPNFYFLDLEAGAEFWADKIVADLCRNRLTLKSFEKFIEKGFDIQSSVTKLDNIYKNS
ncbi:glycosyltransferase [Streptococcus ruminantium]|uniref:glycosyltransferase n=1 Tax=Streptococcus ruminantium TaxID=1917441 RepID=UPI0012DC3577|nr:glycosyltransferase [Streptococcus ruminantium]